MGTFEVLDIITKTELYDLWLRYKEKEMAWSSAEDEAVEYELLVETNVREDTLNSAIHYWLGDDYPEDDLKAYFYDYWVKHKYTLDYME